MNIKKTILTTIIAMMSFTSISQAQEWPGNEAMDAVIEIMTAMEKSAGPVDNLKFSKTAFKFQDSTMVICGLIGWPSGNYAGVHKYYAVKVRGEDGIRGEIVMGPVAMARHKGLCTNLEIL